MNAGGLRTSRDVKQMLEKVVAGDQMPAGALDPRSPVGGRGGRRPRAQALRGPGFGVRASARSRRRVAQRTLVAADLIALALAFAGTELLAAHWAWLAPDRHAFWPELAFFVALLPAWLIGTAASGLDARDEGRADHSTAHELGDVVQLLTIGTWLILLAATVTGWAHPDPLKLSVFWVLAVAALCAGRLSARAVYRRRVAYQQNAIVVGAGRVGQLVARKLLTHPEYGIEVLGFVDDDPCAWHDLGAEAAHGHEFVLGSVDELTTLVAELDVERVIVAFSQVPDEQTLGALREIAYLDVQIDIVPRFFEVMGERALIHTAEGTPLIGLPPLGLSLLARATKRTMDLVGAGLGLLILAPVFAVTAVAIKLSSPGPVFFRQLRMGARNRTFDLLKFRTMTSDAEARKLEFAELNWHAEEGRDARMFKIRSDPRVTAVGRVLRRYSLDELPQLLNVLRGEMSLVGPRPLILDEDSYVEGWARRRLDAKPGITGLWQVHGASAIPFGEMVQLDELYVRTWSLWNDVVLLLRTLPLVMRGSSW
jgi:exopolysaccharide biosynthesis polyprenyl glycosylphosphotransferase